MGSDPVSHLLLVHIREVTHCSSSLFFFCLSGGGSIVLPADLFLQAWRPSAYVISGTINWLSIFILGMLFGYVVVRNRLFILRFSLTRRTVLLILWVDSSLIPPFCPGRPRPILLPDFRGLHHLQRRVSAVVCSWDQRKDNGGDNARLQLSELQEHQHCKFRHSFNSILRRYRLFKSASLL